MRINEVEKILNIPRGSIRFYEKQGLLKPKRDENDYRAYSENDIKILQTIILLRKMGISIERICKLFSNEEDLPSVAANSICELQAQIDSLQLALRLCDDIVKTRKTMDKLLS